MTNRTILFELGQCRATPGALEALEKNKQSAIYFLRKHQSGDWGDNSTEHDSAANYKALMPDRNGEYRRIVSAYTLDDDTRIWIITEADRSSTCILLPSDY